MGKRARTTAYHVRLSQLQGLRLPILCIFFVLGAVLGHGAAQITGGDAELAACLREAASADTKTSASVVAVVLAYARYPLLALGLGYCSFGVAGIPLLLAAQGFTFSFAAAALAASLGRQGVLLALASFGLRSVTTVFCTLLAALWALERATRSSEGKLSSGNVIVVCFLVLTVSIILEFTVIPKLFALALAALN